MRTKSQIRPEWWMSRPVGRILCRRASASAAIHLRSTVAGALVRPTRGLGRAALERPRRRGVPRPFGLAPGGVYPAAAVTCGAGGLLHHRFTLTRTRRPRTSYAIGGPLAVCLCGTVPRVTSGGCYPPPRSVESGPSSAGESPRPTRPPGRLIRLKGSPVRYFQWLSNTSNWMNPIGSAAIPDEHGIAAGVTPA